MSDPSEAANQALDVRRKTEDKAAALASRGHSYTAEQINVIKSTVAVGATNEELALFLTVAQRSGLDPFTKQIHFVKRFDSQQEKMVGAFQVGIDGFRVIASRSSRYQGRIGPWWCGRDGKWLELWTDNDNPPFAAKVGVIVEGYKEPVYATARWNAYRQTKKNGELTRFWATMGPEQLAKCAEALALRIAFPNDLSGLETDDEMGQADNHEPLRVVQRAAAAAVERDEKITAEAKASVAEVLNNPVEDAPAPEGGISLDDRAEVLAQSSLIEIVSVLEALRKATKGERKFFDMLDDKGQPRWVLVDAEILTAIGRTKNGGPVNTWLDQVLRSNATVKAFCAEVLKAADSLGVEVVR